jgi:hypothetical protein
LRFGTKKSKHFGVFTFFGLVLFFSTAGALFAQTVSTSSNITITAIVGGDTSSSSSSSSSSSGGGGGGGSSPTSVTFSGRGYPMSRVILLKDGQEIINTIAGPDAKFSMTVSDLNAGTFTFSILSEDSAGRRSTLFTIPIIVTYGVSTTISGIFLSPTIDIDKQTVKRGDAITIFGQTAPDSVVTISMHSAAAIFSQTTSDKNGAYLYVFNTAPLEYGKHDTQSKAEIVKTNEVAPYGKVLSFIVGDKNTIKDKSCALLRGDFNGDCRVSLIDFSMLAYWYKKATFPSKFDLNGDAKVSFVDFSILAYYWTG